MAHTRDGEEFVHLSEANGTMTEEGLKQEIEQLKIAHAQLEKDKDDLKKAGSEAEQTAQEFKVRSSKLAKRLKEEEQGAAEQQLMWLNTVYDAKDENASMALRQQDLERQLGEVERKKTELDEEARIASARPERKMVFKGVTKDGKSEGGSIDMKPKIFLPVSGGTALITFEKSEAAQNVIDRKEHRIPIEEICFVRVEASTIKLPMPSSVNIDMSVCDLRILVSNIPGGMPQDRLVDKLELFFSKKKNGGGEVESCEILPDSGNVVITFADEGVAKRLTSKGCIGFPLDNKTHQLKVTPYVKGEIKNTEFRISVCQKTVQLTGIPDIMDEEAMQEMLEIFFQKKSNGGGEVDTLQYVPVGKHAIAVFEEDEEETSP